MDPPSVLGPCTAMSLSIKVLRRVSARASRRVSARASRRVSARAPCLSIKVISQSGLWTSRRVGLFIKIG